MNPEPSIHTLVEIIKSLTSAVANARMYFPGHPQVGLQIDAAYMEILGTLERFMELTFVRVADEIIVGRSPIRTKDISLEKFAGELARNGISRVTFLRGLTRAELTAWVTAVASTAESAVFSSRNIQVGKIEIPEGPVAMWEPKPMEGERRLEAELFYDAKLIEVRRLYEGLLGGQPLDPVRLERIVFAFARVFERGTNPLRLLAFLRSVDEYTYTHVVNVFILTMSLAETIGVASANLVDVGIASLLHDMGKLFVPHEVLNKKGKLTPEEWRTIQSHTIRGASYLMGIDGIPHLAVLAALEHHIRYDGNGYPALAEGHTPHLVSQMVAITDAFDAMRSRRAYQDAKPMEYILSVLVEEKGAAFHPLLVDAFIGLVTESS